ncbi:MAG: hypothetical protein CL424_12350 [Acidimicrobiaceae bacterium]|nr:hypothetical protein [Acidimicrobiaceae bacterium]
MNRPNDRRASTSETWLEVVAAVDYLSRGHRPGFGVWDAVEEALRWYTAHLVAGDDDALAASAAAELPWDDPDPLRTALERLILHHPPPAEAEETSSEAIHAALSDWLCEMAHEYNDDHRFAMFHWFPALQPPAGARGDSWIG